MYNNSIDMGSLKFEGAQPPQISKVGGAEAPLPPPPISSPLNYGEILVAIYVAPMKDMQGIVLTHHDDILHVPLPILR
jgi:hypothetical protein